MEMAARHREHPRSHRRDIAHTVLLAVAFLPTQALWASGPYRTENVVIAIMDGTHYDRTFGDPKHDLIPHLWNDLRPQGTYYTRFYNNAVTITLAGHSTIMTGIWHYTRNRGAMQTRPTIMHYMADERGLSSSDSWVIFGKGSYAYSADNSFPGYAESYQPRFVAGIGESHYQHDRDVLDRALKAMREDKPRLMFLNFGVTDHTAHSGNWDYHVGAVKNADRTLYDLWTAIQSDPNYRDRTTLIITSDHGYQDDGIHDGFAEHGDASEGSRHIMLLMLGPDTRRGAVVDKPSYMVDIAPTVGELLGFQTPLASGQVLADSLTAFGNINRGEARTDRARLALSREQSARGPLLSQLADAELTRSREEPVLQASVDNAVLLWGMLSAYDRTHDSRYRDYVDHRRRQWRTGDPLFRGFIDAQLALRTTDRAERAALVASARAIARQNMDRFERSTRTIPEGDRRFLLALIQAAAAAEISHDEALWHRVSTLYFDHVRRVDLVRANTAVTTLRPIDHDLSRASGEKVAETGKVLIDSQHRRAGPNEPWYLLAAAFVRSHGLPFKGEYLSDLPDWNAEVIYRTFLMAEQLDHPGDVWKDPLTSAMTVAAIREVRRRVTLRGPLYEGVHKLSHLEFARLRPESAHLIPTAMDYVSSTIRDRITQTNYNVYYGFPPLTDFDFTLDLLRLHADQANTGLERGMFLLALEQFRRVPTEPFVPSPRE